MTIIDDKHFNNLIAECIDELPDKYTGNLTNVLITYEDEPTQEQRKKMKLSNGQTLFGLYEGVPLVARGNSYNMVLPDKITLFKFPLLSVSRDLIELKSNVKRTLWHEVAHYYGLNHQEIDAIESKWDK